MEMNEIEIKSLDLFSIKFNINNPDFLSILWKWY